jgi:hypothetical protein
MAEPLSSVLVYAKILNPILTNLFKNSHTAIKKRLEKYSAAVEVKKFSKRLWEINKVKTIWSHGRDVPLRDFYYPASMSLENRLIKVLKYDQLPNRNIIIEGIVGQGKSIFMRQLAHLVIYEKLCIPVFIELRTINRKKNLMDNILQFLSSAGIDIDLEIFKYLANSGKLVLLLDGFDEVNLEFVPELIGDLQSLLVSYEDLRIIISSRPGSSVQNVVGFEIIKLEPLVSGDYDGFLSKIVVDIAKRVDLLNAIQNSPENIKDVISTPLMLSLLVIVYESERNIPATLPEFFEKLFNTVFTRHDRIKAGFNRQHYSGLSESKIQKLFEAFCFFIVQHDYGRSITDKQFERAFDLAISVSSGIDCSLENFKKDIVKVSCLMLEDGINLNTFLHKSILDYHAAAFIARCPDELASKFYSQENSNYLKWLPVLQFLERIDTYRYARDYYLKIVNSEIQKVSDLLKHKNDSDLIDYIISRYGDMTINFQGTVLRGWGPNHVSKNVFEYTIVSSLIHIYMLEIGHNNEKSAVKDISIKEAINKSKNQDPYMPVEGYEYANFKTFLEVIGVEKMWIILGVVESELINEIDKYQNLVDSEKAKISIFDIF